MLRKFNFAPLMVSLLLLWGIMSGGCSSDPIKSVKNNPEQMDILMNHIANDNNFRAKMVQKLTTTGDRQKLAEDMVKEEDMSRMLLTKIIETEKGKDDVCGRVGNRSDLIEKALDKSLQMFEMKDVILNKLLSNKEFVDYLRTNEKLKAALAAAPETAENPAEAPKIKPGLKQPAAQKQTPSKKDTGTKK